MINVIHFVILMNISCLPTDIHKLWFNYLDSNEMIYYEGLECWNKYNKKKVCKIASKYGWIDLLEWGIKNDCRWQKSKIVKNIIRYNHTNLINWFFRNNFSLKFMKKFDFYRTDQQKIYESEQEICSYAALGGHLQLLISLLDKGYKYDSEIIYSAAKKNHLEICKYMLKRYPKIEVNISYACGSAAKGGYLDIIEWVLGLDIERNEILCYESICRNAARKGHLHILEWLKSTGYKINFNDDRNNMLFAYTALNGHFGVIEWLKDNSNYDFTKDAVLCSHAASGGHLNILKWARNIGCQWDEWTCANAAKSGHFEILKWARSNNCPWNALTCSYAASNSYFDFEMLKWARDNGCEIDSYTCCCAAESGNLEILKWTIDEVTKINQYSSEHVLPYMCSSAAKEGYLHILQWIKKICTKEEWIHATYNAEISINPIDKNITSGSSRQYFGTTSNYICRDAAENGNFDIIRWLESEQSEIMWSSEFKKFLTTNDYYEVKKFKNKIDF